jgi:hypothetical protein
LQGNLLSINFLLNHSNFDDDFYLNSETYTQILLILLLFILFTYLIFLSLSIFDSTIEFRQIVVIYGAWKLFFLAFMAISFLSIVFIDPFQGGKGRTGTFIASWLLITDFCPSADVALRHFGERRTDESKGTAFQGTVL